MIETIVRSYLASETGKPVYLETPRSVPKEYILIQKTGSGRKNMIDSAVIAVQSISESLFKTAVLNELVKGAMYNFPIKNSAVFNVQLNSDYDFTDTATKQYRYQAVFDITFKE